MITVTTPVTAAASVSNTAAACESLTVRTRRGSAGVELRECPLCYDELPVSDFPELLLQCNHKLDWPESVKLTDPLSLRPYVRVMQDLGQGVTTHDTE